MITFALFYGLWLNNFSCPGFFVLAAIIADCVWLTAAFKSKRK